MQIKTYTALSVLHALLLNIFFLRAYYILLNSKTVN